MFVFFVVVKMDRLCISVSHLLHCIFVIHDALVQWGEGKDRGLLFVFSFFVVFEKRKNNQKNFLKKSVR